MSSNYHSHSSYCDGKFEPLSHLLNAIKKGFHSFGFSSHAPLPFPCKWSMKKQNLETYDIEIQQLKKQYENEIQVYCGLEVDYIPGLTGPKNFSFFSRNLNYLIGSVRFVDKFPDGSHWEIDGSREVFMRGVNQIFEGDIQKV